MSAIESGRHRSWTIQQEYTTDDVCDSADDVPLRDLELFPSEEAASREALADKLLTIAPADVSTAPLQDAAADKLFTILSADEAPAPSAQPQPHASSRRSIVLPLTTTIKRSVAAFSEHCSHFGSRLREWWIVARSVETPVSSGAVTSSLSSFSVRWPKLPVRPTAAALLARWPVQWRKLPVRAAALSLAMRWSARWRNLQVRATAAALLARWSARWRQLPIRATAASLVERGSAGWRNLAVRDAAARPAGAFARVRAIPLRPVIVLMAYLLIAAAARTLLTTSTPETTGRAPEPHQLLAAVADPPFSRLVPPVLEARAPAPAAPVEVPQPVADDTRHIQRVLNKYRDAFSILDVRAAKAVWPSANTAALEARFAGVAHQNYEFDACRINVGTGNAQASCRGLIEYQPVKGRALRREAHAWLFSLRKVHDDWFISDVDPK